jgi:hypothetical protein
MLMDFEAIARLVDVDPRKLDIVIASVPGLEALGGVE